MGFMYSFYSKKGKLVFEVIEREKEQGEFTIIEPRVFLKFYEFENGGTKMNLNWLMNLEEAFVLSKTMRAVLDGKIKDKKFLHKYEDTTTTLKVEKWERNGKSGFGISIFRSSDEKVNFPMAKESFAYLAGLLEYFSFEMVKKSVVLSN